MNWSVVFCLFIGMLISVGEILPMPRHPSRSLLNLTFWLGLLAFFSQSQVERVALAAWWLLGFSVYGFIAYRRIRHALRLRMGLIPPPHDPVYDDEPSHFLLLGEPALTPDQIWFFNTKKSDEDGVVIADTREQVEAWVRLNGWEPYLIVNETNANEWLESLGNPHFWEPRQLIKCATVTGICNKCRWIREKGGNRARDDARHPGVGTGLDTTERDIQLSQERRGMATYWRAHPGLTPENDPTPHEEWMAEVQAIGKALWDGDKQKVADLCAIAKTGQGDCA